MGDLTSTGVVGRKGVPGYRVDGACWKQVQSGLVTLLNYK